MNSSQTQHTPRATPPAIVEEVRSSGLSRVLKLRVAHADTSMLVEDRLRRLAADVRMPGFRSGRVPMPIVRRRFFSRAHAEMTKGLVEESAREVLDQRSLRPATSLAFEILSKSPSEDLVYTVTFEVMPEIPLIRPQEIELEKLHIGVGEEEIHQALQQLADRNRQSETVEEPRAALQDDVVVVDFAGTVNDRPFPGLKGEGQHVHVRDDSFLFPGFASRLVGCRVGESLKIQGSFAKNHRNPRLAGKETEVAVRVRELRFLKPARLDDSLAAAYDCKNIAQLREKVRTQLCARYADVALEHRRRALLEWLRQRASFPVPKELLETEDAWLWQRISRNRDVHEKNAEHKPVEDKSAEKKPVRQEARSNATGAHRPDAGDAQENDPMLRAECKELALHRVRMHLFLSEIGRWYGIAVSEKERAAVVAQEASKFPQRERETVEYLQKNTELLDRLCQPLFERKVLDYLLKECRSLPRSISMQALEKEQMQKSALAETSVRKPSAQDPPAQGNVERK